MSPVTRTVKRSDIDRCPGKVLSALHYNDDGTCHHANPSCAHRDCDNFTSYVVTDPAGDDYKSCETHLHHLVITFTQSGKPITVTRYQRSTDAQHN